MLVPPVVRIVVRVALALVVAMALLVGVTAYRVWHAGQGDYRGKADVVVVLGAAQFDGRPQEYLRARLEHARTLYQEGRAPRILTLGGKQSGDRYTEGEAGRIWLIEHDVPASAVTSVGEGRNTLDSVRAAAAIMKDHRWSSAIVVTDPWHELRSTTMLTDQGVTVHGSPTPTGPSRGGIGVTVRYVARETAAYLTYEASRMGARL